MSDDRIKREMKQAIERHSYLLVSELEEIRIKHGLKVDAAMALLGQLQDMGTIDVPRQYGDSTG